MSFLWDWHAAHYAKKAGLKCFYIPAPESYQIIPTSVSCHHSHHFEWHYSMWVEIFIVLYMLSNSGLLPRHFEIGNSGSYTLCWFGMLTKSCPTLCSPMDCSLPGSSAHGIFQARILSGVPFPTPGDLPNPEIEPASLLSPALASGFFTTSATWEAPYTLYWEY